MRARSRTGVAFSRDPGRRLHGQFRAARPGQHDQPIQPLRLPPTSPDASAKGKGRPGPGRAKRGRALYMNQRDPACSPSSMPDPGRPFPIADAVVASRAAAERLNRLVMLATGARLEIVRVIRRPGIREKSHPGTGPCPHAAPASARPAARIAVVQLRGRIGAGCLPLPDIGMDAIARRVMQARPVAEPGFRRPARGRRETSGLPPSTSSERVSSTENLSSLKRARRRVRVRHGAGPTQARSFMSGSCLSERVGRPRRTGNTPIRRHGRANLDLALAAAVKIPALLGCHVDRAGLSPDRVRRVAIEQRNLRPCRYGRQSACRLPADRRLQGP